ncbi:MAG: cellulase family glycosylhydrolase [Firmicutes bacterium]|nr:cellulase family glycosylhydrolase [Bacillota bacterium]
MSPHPKIRFFAIIFFLILASSTFALSMQGKLSAQTHPIAFGVDLNFYQESLRGKYKQALDAVNRLGAGWIRTGFGFAKSQIEPSPGVWNFKTADKVVAALQRHHLNLLAEIGGSRPPRDPEAFAKYAGKLASHFKGKIAAYKIFNEPQIHPGWTPHLYAQVFALASQAIHQANPKAIVMAGGFWSAPRANRFQAKLFSDPDYPIGKYLDVFNIHMNRTSPKSTARWLKMAQAFLRKQNLHIPIWVDEFAYPSKSEVQWVPGLRSGKKSQAEYFKEILSVMTSDPDVQAIFCTYLIDEPLARRPEERWLGIMDANFRPKPAFQVYRDFILKNQESRKGSR